MPVSDLKQASNRLSVIPDLRTAARSDRRIFRHMVAAPVAPPLPCPLLPSTERFFLADLAKVHTETPSLAGQDVAYYSMQDAVIACAGQIWLGGRLVTPPEVMQRYVANLLDVKNGGSEARFRSCALPIRTINAPCMVAIGHGIQVYGHFL